MIEPLIFYLNFSAALGVGLMAGVFFAFSSFIMNALAQLPAAHGISAMQSINVTVLNRLFFTVFIGTTLASVLLMIISLFNWENPNAAYLLVGSLLYLLGSFMVTVGCNVPLNDTLASIDGKNKESIKVWRDFMSKWIMWNHIRTFTSLAALASFILAL